jgi:hypothetical protein
MPSSSSGRRTDAAGRQQPTGNGRRQISREDTSASLQLCSLDRRMHGVDRKQWRPDTKACERANDGVAPRPPRQLHGDRATVISPRPPIIAEINHLLVVLVHSVHTHTPTIVCVWSACMMLVLGGRVLSFWRRSTNCERFYCCPFLEPAGIEIQMCIAN